MREMFFSCIKRKAICLMMCFFGWFFLLCFVLFWCACVSLRQIFSSGNKNTAYKPDATKISSSLKTIEHVDI